MAARPGDGSRLARTISEDVSAVASRLVRHVTEDVRALNKERQEEAAFLLSMSHSQEEVIKVCYRSTGLGYVCMYVYRLYYIYIYIY